MYISLCIWLLLLLMATETSTDTCMCMYLRILYTFNTYLFPTNCRDSVQAAMEEDAPGLLRVFSHQIAMLKIRWLMSRSLQVLIENGVTVDEMKLYGKNESNEPLDGLSFEDNFSELRAVISKVCHTCAHNLSYH